MKGNRYFKSLLNLLSLYLLCLSATYALPKFTIVTTKKAPQTILGNQINTAQYKVTNNTNITRTLTFVPIKGATQITTGTNACQSPFTLSRNQSCLLTLQLNAKAIDQGIIGGPIVCKTKRSRDNSPDPFLCSQPSQKESLNVKVIPCTPTTCLSDSISNQLRALVAAYKQQYGVPGILAGVWIPGKGQLIIEDGLADIDANRPIDSNDTVRIGSVTKSFVVTIILQLAQESLINLNQPVSDFLPLVQNGNATITQLANMRSGIFNYTEDAAFVQTLLNNLLRKWNPQELVDVADNNNPYFLPNADWHYSNTNTVILGMIIEQVTGNSLSYEIANRILIPLGLKNTFYPSTPNLPSPFARGYSINPIQDLTFVDPSASAGSGAMISKLEDLHKWAIALGKGSLLSSAMQQVRINSLAPVVYDPCADTDPGRAKVTCPEYDKYGIGVGGIDGWIGHTGEYIGYTSLTMYDPSSGAVIAIIANVFALADHVPTKLFEEFVAVLN